MLIFRRLLVFLCLFSVVCFAQPKLHKAADVPIKTTDTKTIHISQYQGKVVMVVMFLTDCADCLTTLQMVGRMQTEFAARGLQVIAISIDDSPYNAAPFAQRYRFPFPIGHLTPDPALQLLNMKKDAHPKVPLIIFIDWMGNVRFQYQGDHTFFKDADKNIHGIATGLLKQAARQDRSAIPDRAQEVNKLMPPT